MRQKKRRYVDIEKGGLENRGAGLKTSKKVWGKEEMKADHTPSAERLKDPKNF